MKETIEWYRMNDNVVPDKLRELLVQDHHGDIDPGYYNRGRWLRLGDATNQVIDPQTIKMWCYFPKGEQ